MNTLAPNSTEAYDLKRIRADFPALHQQVHGKPLVYLDNAATTQKPQTVIDAIVSFYREDCANIHRGVHLLSMRATEKYEGTRRKLQRFLNAPDAREIVFVKGTTDGINLVAQSWARPRLQPGDEILVSAMEHHSNIVPWQMLREQTGAALRVIPIDDAGALILDELDSLLNERTRIVALSHVSNALGTINPVNEIVTRARAVGARVLLDGAQAVPHQNVDLQALGCDFYVLSAHKMYGPTGIGALWAPMALLEEMDPYQGGGDMIKSVTFEETVYNEIPHKFEAGTPSISAGIGLGAAVEYLEDLRMEAIAQHEQDLLSYATERLADTPGLRLIGTAQPKAAVVSFVLEHAHPHDVGTILDQEGVAVRTGHHCAQPVMDRYRVPATVRASFGLYNTRDEVDRLVMALEKVFEIFGR